MPCREALINSSSENDPYRLHRLALLPLLPDATQNDFYQACSQINRVGEQAFSAFIQQQGLAPFWDEKLQANDRPDLQLQTLKNASHQARLLATGHYLLQRHTLNLIRETLEQAGIPHVVFKGADLRERLYKEPALRPAVDIDVLIHQDHQSAAIKAFTQRNFELYAPAQNISHEASLTKGKASIDLHWDILRPGRTRIPMATSLLGSRIDYHSHWGMNEEATLFIMLVHPVFTKYATAPHASLIRMLDLALLLSKKDINWHALLQLLDNAGLKTAAWISLRWYQILNGAPLPPVEFISAIKPGFLKQKYLNYWLEKNLSTLLLEKPAFIQLGLTLPAHDRFIDAVRAFQQARKLRNKKG